MIDTKTLYKISRYIRLLFRQSEVYKQAMLNSVHPTIKGPRGGKRYECAICKEACAATGTQVDHIDPVVPEGMKQKDMPLDEYCSRLYCDVENLQVLCEACHKVKTNSEKKKKRENKCVNKIDS